MTIDGCPIFSNFHARGGIGSASERNRLELKFAIRLPYWTYTAIHLHIFRE